MSNRVSIDWNGSVFILTHNDSSGNTSYKYSYDGVLWETADVPVSVLSANSAFGAKWVGDRMLITGNLSTTQGNVVITSPDGIHYSITKTANGVQLRDVETNLEYRNTIMFPHTVDLALGGLSIDTNKIAYSLDKTNTWHSSVNSSGVFSVSANHAVWNGRVWVAVGEGGNTIATSNDGDEWIGRGKYIFSERASGVAWSKEQNLFVAVGQGTTVAYSVDGVFWLSGNIPGIVEGKCVGWNGEIWVAGGVPTTNGSIAYSRDGKTWTSVSGMFSGNTHTIEWNGTYWSAFGEDPSYTLATSANGIDWRIEYSESITPTPLYNDMFFLQETSGNTYLKSVDGVSWDSFSAIQDLSMSVVRQFTQNTSNEAVANIQPLSIATGEGINTLAYSADGIFWTGLGSNVFTERANRAVWNGRVWVAVGKGRNWVATSYDGLIWTGRNATLMTEGYDVAWNGSRFIAVGEGATTTLATSTDGIHWEAIPNSANVFTTRASAITWTGRTWLAYGSGGNTSACSQNGITWTTTPEKNAIVSDMSSVFWESGYFTSSVLSGFSATQSNGTTPHLAFDHTTNTEWYTTSGSYTNNSGVYSGGTTTTYDSANTALGEWIQLSIPTAQVIKYYTIAFSTDTSTNAIPREWILLGSNNGSSWSEIHSFGFETALPPNNTWKYSRIVLPINLFSNNTTYTHYRLVVIRTFGNTDAKIADLDLFIENAHTTTIPIREKPIALKNNVLFPFVTRDYTLADLSLNSLNVAPVNGGEYVNSRLYGLVHSPITSVCFDGTHFFLTDVSGNVAYMTNESSNTHLNTDTSFNGSIIDSRLSTIYGSCWNQQFVLFGGVGGITYGRLDAGTTWTPTNASRLFSTVYGVASNAGYGFTYIPNAVYLHTNEILRVVGPKAYTMPGETALKFNLHNSNIV